MFFLGSSGDAVCHVDVVFAVDNSGSINDADAPGQVVTNWQLILNFVSDLVEQFNVGPNSTHVGFVDFGRARLHFEVRSRTS